MTQLHRRIWLASFAGALLLVGGVLFARAQVQTRTHILNPPAAATEACVANSPVTGTTCMVDGTLVSESEPFPLNPNLTSAASIGSNFANAFGYGDELGADALAASGINSSSGAVAIIPFQVTNSGSWVIDFTFSASAQAQGGYAEWTVQIGTLIIPFAVVPGTDVVPHVGFTGGLIGGSTAPAWPALEFPLYQWTGEEVGGGGNKCKSGFVFDNFNGPNPIPTTVDVSFTECGRADRNVTFPLQLSGGVGYVLLVGAGANGSDFPGAPGSGGAIVDPTFSVDPSNPGAILKIGAPLSGTQGSILTLDNVAELTALGFSLDRLTKVGIKLPSATTPPPVTAAVATPGPNGFGWNNTDVVITLNAADSGGPGVKQITLSATGAQNIPSTIVPGNSAAVTINTEGHTMLSFFSTAVSGNIETTKTLTVNLDKTPPTITDSRVPAANQYGWNNTNVSVSFQCSDNLSGLAAGSPPGPTVLSSEGAGQSVTGTCTDVAGNSASSTVSGINIDKSPPTVACSASPIVLWPPNNKLAPVNVSVTVTDSLSGPAGFSLTSVTSNEPDSGQGDIQGFVTGTASTSGQLRAQRLGSGNGRVYTFTYSGSDRAGNTATCTTTVSVPHDQGQN